MMNRQGIQKLFTNKIQSMGGMGAFKNQVAKAMPTSMSNRVAKAMPTSMFYRPPVVANKARGTMSSSTHTPVKGGI